MESDIIARLIKEHKKFLKYFISLFHKKKPYSILVVWVVLLMYSITNFEEINPPFYEGDTVLIDSTMHDYIVDTKKFH